MIFNMTGGGSGSGATLVVSCPANVTVTVSKDDKSYTKNSGNLGSATFKGLSTGTWSVTIQSSSQTATKNITITADYAITMAFFAAYINITYPANSTCTVKTSGGVTVASNSNTGTSTKTWRATVGATGTYTVTATATDGSGKTKSTTVSITADGQSESATLSYELVLFDKDKGIDRTDITGGWSKYKDGYIGYYDNNDSSRGRGCMCKTAVDFSGYSSLVFKTGTVIYNISAQGGLSSSYNGNDYVNLSPRVSIGSNQTYRLDVSNVNTPLYIGFNTGIHGDHYAVDQILVSYVHLE